MPPGFMQGMLMSKLIGGVVDFLPEPAREALVDLRDYVSKHGKLPKFDPLRSTPLAPNETAEAIGVYLGDAPAGSSLRMLNLMRGQIQGGALRGVNAVLGGMQSGSLRGSNMLIGEVSGGELRGVNLILGNVLGGKLTAVNTIIGDIHGGEVKCYLLIGNVLGGKVIAKLHLGQVSGGETTIERTLG